MLREPGGQRVGALLDRLDRGEDLQIAVSSVTWCEILTRLHRNNDAMTGSELAALLDGVTVVAFGRLEAERAADLSLSERSLSLGDRACLALARSNGATAWTADKIWKRLQLGISIEMIRH